MSLHFDSWSHVVGEAGCKIEPYAGYYESRATACKAVTDQRIGWHYGGEREALVLA